MRAIVSTPDVLGGRWRLDGHRIHVSLIRNWITECGLDEFNDQFPHVNLTQEEADACLAWTFPPTRDAPELDAEGDVRCLCGEWAEYTDRDTGVATCTACGRRYGVTVTLIEAAGAARDGGDHE